MDTTENRIPVIIDTDPGSDDALAIMYLLASPVDVIAITTVTGNNIVSKTTRNALTVLHVVEKQIKYLETAECPAGRDPQAWDEERRGMIRRLKRSRPVLAVGADKPLACEYIGPESFHGDDGLGCMHKALPHLSPTDWESIIAMEQTCDYCTLSRRSAAEEILHQLREAPPFTITILAIGPTTNLALAFRRDPLTFSRVKQIFVLGGAINVPGNITPSAEFNFYVDPHAIELLAKATQGFNPSEGVQLRIAKLKRGQVVPLHLTLVPTDVTSKINLSRPYLVARIAHLDSPLAVFMRGILEVSFEYSRRLRGTNSIKMHDPLAAALLVDMSLGRRTCKTEYCDLKVETCGEYTRGMCLVRRDYAPKVVNDQMLHPNSHIKKHDNDLFDDDIVNQGAWQVAKVTCVEVLSEYNEAWHLNDYFAVVFALSAK